MCYAPFQIVVSPLKPPLNPLNPRPKMVAKTPPTNHHLIQCL